MREMQNPLEVLKDVFCTVDSPGITLNISQFVHCPPLQGLFELLHPCSLIDSLISLSSSARFFLPTSQMCRITSDCKQMEKSLLH